jgi:uncharacterized protein (TIGR02231 family)
MKILFTFLCTIFCSSLFAQNELRVPVNLKKVTVFQNRAQLSSELKTTVGQGITKVYLTNIAATIDPNSIQIAGKGDVIILGVKYQVNNLGTTKNAPMQDSLEAMTEKKQDQEVLLQVASHEETMMMANVKIKNNKDGIIPEDLKDMVEYFNQKLTEIGNRKLKIIRTMAKMNKQIEALTNEIQNNNAVSSTGVPEILVTISANTPAAMLLEVNYIANGAGWSPLYDIRANGTKNPISLAYKANVFQQTGLDWNNVLLTLSTANPSQNGVKPNLNPQMLSVYEPAPIKLEDSQRMRSVSGNVQIVEIEEKANFASSDKEVISASYYSQWENNTLNALLEIKTPYTISKSGNPEMIDVQNLTIPADFEFSSVPKYDTDAFLVAKIGNWAKYNLLNGTANVYFDGSFVGETMLQNYSTDDSLKISLGRDKKIIIKREEIAEFKAQKAVGSNIKQTQAFKITLRNTKNEANSINIEDQLPVSQDSRIEVETIELSGGNMDAATGKISWNLKLNPNETKELIVKYSVKYPKGKTVNNL